MHLVHSRRIPSYCIRFESIHPCSLVRPVPGSYAPEVSMTTTTIELPPSPGRIPLTVIPTHYDLTYTSVDLERHTFAGVVSITVDVPTPIPSLAFASSDAPPQPQCAPPPPQRQPALRSRHTHQKHLRSTRRPPPLQPASPSPLHPPRAAERHANRRPYLQRYPPSTRRRALRPPKPAALCLTPLERSPFRRRMKFGERERFRYRET